MKEYNFLTTPIVDIVNNIIIDAVNMNASDIHFDSSEKFLKIRIRVDGELRDYSIVDNKYKRNLVTRIKLLSGMNITESRLPQDGAIKGVIGGKDLDMRVSCLPTIFGEKVVIRILDYTMSLKGIESLGFTKENYEQIMKMLANPNGIILVTGATGSGKSTTTYAMLQRLNSEDRNIITVEDPVEMNIEGINQVQVNSEIGLDFASVLRSILRQDPNVILIGEIRDTETAQIAIRSSITGHLVLSTLHTNNSLTSIERLLDMNVERYLLSASLKGIVSQNLAKRLCPKCKVKRPTTEAEKRLFKKQLHMDVNEVYEHGTCSECRNGYKGRIAIQEVLLLNDEIRDAINDSMKRNKLRDLTYGKGVKTLLQDGLIKVVEGSTSLEEVLKIVDAESDSAIYGKDEDEIQEETQKEELKVDNTNDKIILTPKNIYNPVQAQNEQIQNVNPAPVQTQTQTPEQVQIPTQTQTQVQPQVPTEVPLINANEQPVTNPAPNNSVNTINQEINNIPPTVNESIQPKQVYNFDTNTMQKPVSNTVNNNEPIYSNTVNEQKPEEQTINPQNTDINNNVTNLINNILNKHEDISPTINYSSVVTADKLLEKNKTPDLESTQDIFASLWNDTNKTNENNNEYITMNDVTPQKAETNDVNINTNNNVNKTNYTNDLLNLINSNLNGTN